MPAALFYINKNPTRGGIGFYILHLFEFSSRGRKDKGERLIAIVEAFFGASNK